MQLATASLREKRRERENNNPALFKETLKYTSNFFVNKKNISGGV